MANSLFFSLISSPPEKEQSFPFDVKKAIFLGSKEWPGLSTAGVGDIIVGAVVKPNGNVIVLNDDETLTELGHPNYSGHRSVQYEFGNYSNIIPTTGDSANSYLTTINNTIAKNLYPNSGGGMAIHPDGTKLWLTYEASNNSTIFELDFGKPFDITTLSNTSTGNTLRLSLNSTSTSDFYHSGATLRNFQWLDSGNIALISTLDGLSFWEAPTPYSISNLWFKGSNTFPKGYYRPALTPIIGLSDTIDVRGLDVSEDGTKAWIYDKTTRRVFELSLRYPFVVSSGLTAVRSANLASLANVGLTPDYFNLRWANNGAQLFFRQGTSSTANIAEFRCNTAYDINDMYLHRVHDLNRYAWFETHTPYFRSFEFSPTGNIVFLSVNSGDYLNYFELGRNWDLTTIRAPLQLQRMSLFSLSLTGTNQGFTFDNAGTRVFTVDNNDVINTWYLGNAYSFSNVWSNLYANLNVNAQESSPTDIKFNNDGTKLYVMGVIGDDINMYDLSVAYDVTTATFNTATSIVVADTNPYGFYFKPDGTKVYVVGQSNDRVTQFTVTNAWDISSLSLDGSFSVSAQEVTPEHVIFNNAGTRMFVAGSTGNDVNEYSLSEAWNVQTSTFVTTANSITGNVETSTGGMSFDDTGNIFFSATSSWLTRHRLSSTYRPNTALTVSNISSRRDYNTGYFSSLVLGNWIFLDQRTSGNVVIYDQSPSPATNELQTYRFDGNTFYDMRYGPTLSNTTQMVYTYYDGVVRSNGNILLLSDFSDTLEKIILVEPYTITPNIASGNVFNRGNVFRGTYHHTFDYQSAVIGGDMEYGIYLERDNGNILITQTTSSGGVTSTLKMQKYTRNHANAYEFNSTNGAGGNFTGTGSIFDFLQYSTRYPGESSATFSYPVVRSDTGDCFTRDGKVMLLGTTVSRDSIDKFTLPNAFDLTGNTKNTYSSVLGVANVAAYESALYGVCMSHDGGNLYTIGQGGGGVAGTGNVNQFHLSTPYLISSATHARKLTLPLETYTTTVFFNQTGNIMITCGGEATGVSGNIASWSLSTPWDISTATINHKMTRKIFTSFARMYINPEGTKLFLHQGNYIMTHWDLNTAWDLSTNAQVYHTTNFTNPMGTNDLQGFYLSNTGTKLMIIGDDTWTSKGTSIISYDLSTPWDVSTKTLNSNILHSKTHLNYDTAFKGGDYRGIAFDHTGTRMYIPDYENSHILQYKL